MVLGIKSFLKDVFFLIGRIFCVYYFLIMSLYLLASTKSYGASHHPNFNHNMNFNNPHHYAHHDQNSNNHPNLNDYQYYNNPFPNSHSYFPGGIPNVQKNNAEHPKESTLGDEDIASQWRAWNAGIESLKLAHKKEKENEKHKEHISVDKQLEEFVKKHEQNFFSYVRMDPMVRQVRNKTHRLRVTIQKSLLQTSSRIGNFRKLESMFFNGFMRAKCKKTS